MKQMLSDNELSVFAEQLSMILHAGISVPEGISILVEDAPAQDGQKLLSAVNDALNENGSLAESLRVSGAWPDYFIKMTEIGEQSGTLEEVMDSLSSYYNRQDSLMHSIRESLTYPLVLLGMLLAVLIVLMTQVMPVFQQVFEQLGIEMTGISNTVFSLGRLMQRGSIFVLGLIIAAALGCLIGLRHSKGRAVLRSIVLAIPLARRVNELLSCSRFSDAFSLSLHSGLDMGEGFELAAGLVDSAAFKERLSKAGTQIEQGNDLGESLREAGIFTGLDARMVTIGFRTGSAETVLRKIAVSTQSEADNRIQAAVGALEPTLTAILSVLTGLILISVMLPLLGVMTNIG